MIGAIILAVVIVIVFPVTVAMSGGVASAILGFFLKGDADDRYEGSELLDLN